MAGVVHVDCLDLLPGGAGAGDVLDSLSRFFRKDSSVITLSQRSGIAPPSVYKDHSGIHLHASGDSTPKRAALRT